MLYSIWFTPRVFQKVIDKLVFWLDFIVTITGQDIMSAGLTGALFGGLLCASELLDRNLYNDLQALKKELKKSS